MKNTFKTGLLALVIAASFAACKGSESSNSNTDSSSTSSSTNDTSAKMDTSNLKKDTTAVKSDTSKGAAGVDTIKKTVTKTTVEKKTTK